MNNRSGFTFIEVLLAMAIFVSIAVVAVDLTRGSVRGTRDAREVSTATWLLQKQMVELETKIEQEGFEKACEKKQDGKFEDPHSKYTWVATCEEIDFKLSETAAKMAASEDGDSNEPTTEDMVMKAILSMASDYMSKSIRELHVEVAWEQGKNRKTVDATTHLVRLDQAVAMPQITQGGGGSN